MPTWCRFSGSTIYNLHAGHEVPEQAPHLQTLFQSRFFPEVFSCQPEDDGYSQLRSSTGPLLLSPTTDSPCYILESNPEEVRREEMMRTMRRILLIFPADGWRRWRMVEDDNHRNPSTSYSPPPHIILSHTRADTPPSGTPPLGTPPLLPILAPTLLLPSADHEADRPEVCLPPQKRLCIDLGPRYEVGESLFAATARLTGGFRADYGFVTTMDREIRHDLERDVNYKITDTWDEMLVDMPGAPATNDTELGRWMTKFATRVRQDTDEIYVRLDDEQTERQLMAGRLNMLYRDRRAHARTTLLMEREARKS
ncbi:hypothetical protein Tco_0619730 [Tanacetum coccineum]